MASENDTIADIIAEISTMGEYRVIANRLDAAWKREQDRLMSEPRSWEECVERAMKVKENSDVPY